MVGEGARYCVKTMQTGAVAAAVAERHLSFASCALLAYNVVHTCSRVRFVREFFTECLIVFL